MWNSSTIKSDHDFCGKINIFSRQINGFNKQILKSWFHGKFLRVIAISHCGKMIIALLTIYCHQNLFPSNQLFSNLFSKKRCFHEISSFPHWEFLVWKLREFSLAHFWQKIRESNGFTKCKLLKSWFDEIFLWIFDFT